jgi:drug/metabolite transporter (DMT)-like permease
MAVGESQPVLRNDRLGWIIVAAAAMCWGSDVLLRPKALAAGLDSVAVVFFEHAALTVLFLPALIIFRSMVGKIRAKEFAALLFISWAGSTLATVLLTQAYVQGDPLTATLLQKLQPIFAIVLAGPVLKERQKGAYWVWFLVALAGAYMLSFGLTWIGDPLNHKGFVAAFYAIGAAALWGACTVVGRWSLAHLHPVSVAGLRFTFALPLLFVWALIGGHLSALPSGAVSAALLPLGLMVLLPDALGMALYYVGLAKTTASVATLAELAYPATAILVSLNSVAKFTSMQWVGLVLLLGSLYWIQKTNLVVRE